MADDKRKETAIAVFNTLCDVIEHLEWEYEKDEEDLTVQFLMKGEDIPMQFILHIDAGRQLIRLLSPLPFKMSEENRVVGAIATCAASFGLSDGNFDYDLSSGRIAFRVTASFRESLIGEELFQYMLMYSCLVVDKYNDQFFAIEKGLLSIEDFIKKE